MDVLRKNKPIVFSIIFALTAVILLWVVYKQINTEIPVVVAKNNLSVGFTIENSDIEVRSMPISAVPKTSFSSVEQVVGKTITAGPIINGSMIRAEHLGIEGSLYTTLKSFAPKDWVAVELPNGASVGMKGIRRGDKVDILGDLARGEGFSIDYIVRGAVVLRAPTSESRDSEVVQQFIVAVPEQYVPAVAGAVLRNQPVTVVLPEKTTVTQSVKAPITIPTSIDERGENVVGE